MRIGHTEIRIKQKDLRNDRPARIKYSDNRPKIRITNKIWSARGLTTHVSFETRPQ